MKTPAENLELIKQLESKIKDLKKRWPIHSVPMSMMEELEDLEDALANETNKIRYNVALIDKNKTTLIA